MSESTQVSPKRTSGSWKPGQSGNPRGKPRGDVNIAALARSHAPKAMAALVEALKSPKERVSAATAILDRAFGKPKQSIETISDSTLTLHLVAAQTIGRELLETINATSAPTIDGQISSDAQDDTGGTKQLDQTVPIE